MSEPAKQASAPGTAAPSGSNKRLCRLSDDEMITALSGQVTSLSSTVAMLSATITRQNELIQSLLKNPVRPVVASAIQATLQSPTPAPAPAPAPASRTAPAPTSTPAPSHASSSSAAPVAKKPRKSKAKNASSASDAAASIPPSTSTTSPAASQQSPMLSGTPRPAHTPAIVSNAVASSSTSAQTPTNPVPSPLPSLMLGSASGSASKSAYRPPPSRLGTSVVTMSKVGAPAKTNAVLPIHRPHSTAPYTSAIDSTTPFSVPRASSAAQPSSSPLHRQKALGTSRPSASSSNLAPPRPNSQPISRAVPCSNLASHSAQQPPLSATSATSTASLTADSHPAASASADGSRMTAPVAIPPVPSYGAPPRATPDPPATSTTSVSGQLTIQAAPIPSATLIASMSRPNPHPTTPNPQAVSPARSSTGLSTEHTSIPTAMPASSSLLEVPTLNSPSAIPLTLHSALANPNIHFGRPTPPPIISDHAQSSTDSPLPGSPTAFDAGGVDRCVFPHYGKDWLPGLLSAWWYPDPEHGVLIPLWDWDLPSRLATRDKWKKAEWMARGWHIIKGHHLEEYPHLQPEKLDLATLDADVEAWKARWGDKQNTSLAVIRQYIRDDPAYASWAPVKFGEEKKRKSEAEAEAAAAAARGEEPEREYRFIEYDPIKKARGMGGDEEEHGMFDAMMCLDDFAGQSLMLT